MLHQFLKKTVSNYREIKNRQVQIALQKDLNLLENWGSKWGMRFNAAKCNIMQMSRKQTPISTQYELSGQVLEEVKDAKYLGVTVSDDLEWTMHINAITTKTNSKLSFLRRNLKSCPEKLRETAYFALLLLSIHSSLLIGGSPFLLLYGGSPPASPASHLAGLLRRRDPSTNPGPTALCVSVGN